MASYSKVLLSGSTNGLPVSVTATTTPGTTVHTAVAGTLSYDSVYLWATNTSSSAVTLTVEWGGTTDPTNHAVKNYSLAANSGPVAIITGQTIQNGLTVGVFASVSGAINITGFCNRINPTSITSLSLISTGYSGVAQFGLNTQFNVSDGVGNLTPPMTGTASKIWRQNMTWSNVEQSSGIYALTSTGIAVGSIFSSGYLAGLTPFCVLATQLSRFGENCYDTSAPHYSGYCNFVASTFPYINDFEISNEINAANSAVLNPTAYLQLCKNSYSAIKAVNPNARVWIGAFLDPEHEDYQSRLYAINSGEVFNYCDGISAHHYKEAGSSQSASPEYIVRRSRNGFAGLVSSTAVGKAMAITEFGWATAGTNPVSETKMGQYEARALLMFRSLNYKYVMKYGMYDFGGGFGVYVNAGTPKGAQPYYLDINNHINSCSSASYYQSLPLHYVKMSMTDGNNRLALWGHNDDGTNEFVNDTSGTSVVYVNAAAAGNLITQNVGVNTTSQPIARGVNAIPVAYSGNPVVLYSTDTSITFLGT